MKLNSTLKNLSFLATLAIPLEKNALWSEISFGKIPTNTVVFSPSGIHVEVKKSASPLVFKLQKVEKVTRFEINLKFKGDIRTAPSTEIFEEDSLFRIGLVAEGDQKLTGLKKLISPDWVKKLFALAPQNTGLDKIYFFNVGRIESQVGKSRPHPKSDLMFEEVIASRIVGQNTLTISKDFPQPLKVAALWVSIDGDDTKSDFQTSIESLVLHTQEPAP